MLFKKILDVVIAIIGLIALLPFFAAIGFLIYISMGRPIFFKQVRPGLNGKPFTMYKFRTMSEGLDKDGRLLPSHLRVTSVGKFLRATSLDELPELWNVIKGDMSLVGPRPLLMDYLALYSSEQARRHEVKPGITGWAQVNGRNAISWEQKFELDIWYVNNRSLWLDIKILLLTVKKVLFRDGINSSEDVTMPRFEGSGKKRRG